MYAVFTEKWPKNIKIFLFFVMILKRNYQQKKIQVVILERYMNSK